MRGASALFVYIRDSVIAIRVCADPLQAAYSHAVAYRNHLAVLVSFFAAFWTNWVTCNRETQRRTRIYSPRRDIESSGIILQDYGEQSPKSKYAWVLSVCTHVQDFLDLHGFLPHLRSMVDRSRRIRPCRQGRSNLAPHLLPPHHILTRHGQPSSPVTLTGKLGRL